MFERARSFLAASAFLVILAASALFPTHAHANHLTATIEAIQIHKDTNGAYVRLTGAPTFDGGPSCTSTWAKASLDDDKFMIFIWPLLMSAKNKGISVTVNVDGCLNGYPEITWAQVNAT